MTIFTLAFWDAAAERAIKTAAQTALVTIGADRLDQQGAPGPRRLARGPAQVAFIKRAYGACCMRAAA